MEAAKQKNISIQDMNRLFSDLSKFNSILSTEQTKDDLVKLDDKLKEPLGMINFIHSLISTKGTENSDLGIIADKLKHIDELTKKIISERYVGTDDKMYIEIESGETWKILSDIFSIFVKLKDDIEKISQSKESYDKISEIISGHVISGTEKLEAFEKTLMKLLEYLNESLGIIQKAIYDEYKISDIIYTQKKVSKEEFKSKYSPEKKFSTFVTGYNEVIASAMKKDFIDAFNELQFDKIKSDYFGKLDEIYGEIMPLITKKYVGINDKTSPESQRGGSEKTMRMLYKFNINLQKIQEMLNVTMLKLKEEQHYKMRFNNYLMYNIYCLTIPSSDKERKIYTYMDKDILIYYRTELNKIIMNFNNYQKISDKKEKDALIYFNIYHYFTIKKLCKFFDFMILNIGENIIDIDKCTGYIQQSFILFNHFKDILDTYTNNPK